MGRAYYFVTLRVAVAIGWQGTGEEVGDNQRLRLPFHSAGSKQQVPRLALAARARFRAAIGMTRASKTVAYFFSSALGSLTAAESLLISASCLWASCMSEGWVANFR